MPEFVDWAEARDLSSVLSRVAAQLDAGKWVVFPSETGPVLAARADRPKAFDELPTDVSRWSLVLPEADSPARWVGDIPVAVRRLMRRAWPGPVTFEFALASRPSVPGLLSPGVLQHVAPDGYLPLRRPAHDALLELMAELDGPLALAESSDSGPQWLANLGESVSMVLEDGPAQFDAPPTRVRVDDGRWTVVEPGVYGEDELQRLTACLVLFVCTGNTCRSPMAEALFKMMLAKHLGCEISELPSRGYWVMSAGVAASGGGAAEKAMAIVAARGADLSAHESRPVRPELAAVADHIIAMTASHMNALLASCPELGTEPRLLCGDEDLPDPIGGDQSVYEHCANAIQTHLARLVGEVTAS